MPKTTESPVLTRSEIWLMASRPESGATLTADDQILVGRALVQHFRDANGDLNFSFTNSVGEKMSSRIPEEDWEEPWHPDRLRVCLDRLQAHGDLSKRVAHIRFALWILSAIFRACPSLEVFFRAQSHPDISFSGREEQCGHDMQHVWSLRFEWTGPVADLIPQLETVS